jgi:cell division inhibitor SepF
LAGDSGADPKTTPIPVKSTWRKSLEYFGLVEGDYADDAAYRQHETGSSQTLTEDPIAAPRVEADPAPRRAGRGRGREDDIDEIFSEDDIGPRGRSRRSMGVVEPLTDTGSVSDSSSDFSMHVVTPRSFNDAQQVADEFKRSKPVIINLQSSDRELSKRLIDFSSGMTYALGGGMQRISQGIFLLTPQNVDVSAEEKARILEGGFFNQS